MRTRPAGAPAQPLVPMADGYAPSRHRHRRYWPGIITAWPWYPSYYYPYVFGPEYPTWYQPQSCPPPLVDGCRQLNITARWVTACFLPRYQYLRSLYGVDWQALASAVAREEAPDCPFPATTGAAAEYARRVQLAVAALLNAEGFNVPYPLPPVTPRPWDADQILQPWMRALMTGWL